MEMQIGVAGVADPVEVAEDAVGKAMPPGPHQDGAEHHQRDIGEDRHAEGEGHVIAHPQLAAYLHLSERPADKGADRADRDDLPQSSLHQRREAQAIAEIGRRDVDEPRVEGALLRGPPENQDGAERGEERRRHPEEADVERSDPEVEQITADESPSPDPVFAFETEQSHVSASACGGPAHAAGLSVKFGLVCRGQGIPPAALSLAAARSAPVFLSGDFKPVETVGAQKHEMDHRRQQEQEHALRHEHAARIEDQPDLVEFSHLSFPPQNHGNQMKVAICATTATSVNSQRPLIYTECSSWACSSVRPVKDRSDLSAMNFPPERYADAAAPRGRDPRGRYGPSGSVHPSGQAAWYPGQSHAGLRPRRSSA